jgi:hypothetical protein
MLSKEVVGRPVKVIWTREDDVHNGRFRPISAHYLRAGLDTSGKMGAWHHRVAVDRIGPYYEPVFYQRPASSSGGSPPTSDGRKILVVFADRSDTEQARTLLHATDVRRKSLAH